MKRIRPEHVGISVGDLDASIAWYRDMLGFELDRVVDVPEQRSGKVAILRADDFRIELFCMPGAAPLPAGRSDPWSDILTHGIKHVAYAVPDIAALVHELKAKGVDVVWDGRVHDGDACAFVRDNSGNLVEFIER